MENFSRKTRHLHYKGPRVLTDLVLGPNDIYLLQH